MRKSLPDLNSRLATYADSDGVAYYRQGEQLANQQRYAEALVCFDHVLERQVNYDAAWIFRGVMLIYLEQYREALCSCERAIALYPHNPEAWIFRGVALYRMGHYQQAYASYDQALGIHWHTKTQRFNRFRRFWQSVKRWRLPWLL